MAPAATHDPGGRTTTRALIIVVSSALLATVALAEPAEEAAPPSEPQAPPAASTSADDEDALAEPSPQAPVSEAEVERAAELSRQRARAVRRERAMARLAATRVIASDPEPESEPAPGLRAVQPVTDEWARGARFFGGLRSGIGFAPGGLGPAGTLGLELGVTAFRGLGFGLHVFGIGNPPEVPLLNIPRAEYGMGAAVDVRWYLQTIRPLKLYPTMSVGFMAGPSVDSGANVVLPTVTPGFGARVNIGEVYVSLEMGAATFYIPFVNLAVGWEPTHTID